MNAEAQLTQPDGSVIPAQNNLANILNNAPLNEGINVINEASLVPEVFTPNNSLTFSFVAEGGGYENAFGWYNLGDDVTQAQNRFVIFNCAVEPTNPYETRVINFCGNPEWKGGAIGFFLITPQRRDGGGRRSPNCARNDNVGYIYYSEPRLNIDEDPNNAFIHHLVYRSNTYPNAFYFGFEDLFRGGDNDFEDTLVLVEGLLVGDAPELCDGLDDDCDGRIDEGAEVNCSSVCGQGLRLCEEGALSACSAPDPVEELCDGIDNDCDGQLDEGVTQVCNNACGEGVEVCVVGQWAGCTAPTPTEERCNNVDEDCDGVVDEGLAISCVNGCGVEGERQCVAGSYGLCDAPPPVIELCDGADNDCDGRVDENVIQICNNGCGSGVERCESGVFVACDAPTPSLEVCDGADNDCDGLIDEEITRECTSQCGAVGVEQCLGGLWIGCTAIQPRLEVCNLIDDDCDGRVDESLSQECQSACGQGEQQCSEGAWSACDAPLPQRETCDGEDQDCDGRIDEGVTQSCRAECGVGLQLCINGLFLDCNIPPPQEELCDDIDNDCDGLIDERLERSCDALCGSGSELCIEGEWVDCSAPTPRAETCNALDDDCDGLIDEALIRVCDNPCGEGMSRCELGRWSDCPALSATEERCDGEDNDCDGLSDERVICEEASAICIRGRCAEPCASGECSVGQECIEDVCLDLPCQNCRTYEICENDRCLDPCSTIDCAEGQYCDQGECLEGECYEGGCTAGKICVGGRCRPNDCDLVSCGLEEGCLDGRCFVSCAQVNCADSQRCVRGECIADACQDISCAEGELCTAGGCVPDVCSNVLCPPQRRCEMGRCVDDPCTRVNCPAESECVLRREGVTDCIPLLSSTMDEPSVVYPESEAGEEGSPINVLGGDPVTEEEEVAESIAGGCQQTERRGRRLPLFFMLLFSMLIFSRKFLSRRHLFFNASIRLLISLLSLSLVFSACDESSEPVETTNGGMSSENGPFLINGCSPRIEICNGEDDDCDGVVDNVSNLDRDADNCGVCGVKCDYPEGEGSCVQGVCRLARCLPGFVNADGSSANGCEEVCEINSELEDGTDVCNMRDDDCDGVVDEGYNLGQDADHCGACGVSCYVRGVTEASCLSGRCVISACETGFLNLDGDALNGCEYLCEGAGASEQCNGSDDDCDGRVDEEVPLEVSCLTEGLCAGVRPECRGDDGAVCLYPAEVKLSGEIRCDGRDEDCDGLVDEDFLGLGDPCDSDDDDLCFNGVSACSNDRSAVICQERVNIIERCDGEDNDCDERIDEGFFLLFDALNCGVCGQQCPTVNTVSSCRDGACVVDDCMAGYVDLDQDPTNGCEYTCEVDSAAGSEGMGAEGVEVTERCDGVDNDCDGRVDEELSPPQDATCLELGICAGISPTCLGAAGFVCLYPGNYELGEETRCDSQDNDCDGLIDESFPELGALCDGADNDLCLGGVLRCSADPIAALICSDSPDGISERCDEVDNDCDGFIDENYDLSGDPLNCGRCGVTCSQESAETQCFEGLCEITACAEGLYDVNGVTLDGCEYSCEPSLEGVEVCNGVDDDCDGNIDEEISPPVDLSCDAPGVCRGVSPSCRGEVGFVCEFPEEVYQGVETRCDQLDNDCDGQVDEASAQPALAILGELCGGGVGACARQGVQVCSQDEEGTRCSASEGQASAELCNGIDDDCDGRVDEEIERESEMVLVSQGGLNYWIDRWEASRPDATENSIGLDVSRSCSKPQVKPWANVTLLEAEEACSARGKRLCTDREWTTACGEIYPYGSFYNPTACVTEEAEMRETGSSALCESAIGTFDMSGNLAEWALCEQAQDCQIVHPQLGGSYADRVVDIWRCDFRGNAVPTISTATAGFRCCADP